MQVSLVQCLDKSGKIVETTDIQHVLNLIKNNPKKKEIIEAISHPTLGGKANKNLVYTDMVWDRKTQALVPEKRNLYQHIKSTELQVVTWNASFTKRRNKKSINKLSGYIYGDVDDFQYVIDSKDFDATSFEESQAHIQSVLTNKSLKFVKAVWKSVSGKGFGFLMKVEELNLNNFKSTWNSLYDFFLKRGVKLDAQTKDVTRPNVISYDPNIFIRDNDEVIEYTAVEEIQKKVHSFEGVEAPVGIIYDILDYALEVMYKNEKKWTHTPFKRLSYNFYFDFFILCNKNGINLNKALDFLRSKVEEYPALFSYRDVNEVDAKILQRIDDEYGEQFGLEIEEEDDDVITVNSYVINEVYKEFTGNVELKMRYVWHNLGKHDYDIQKKLKMFCIILKESGILKKFTVNFLEEHIILNDGDYRNIKYIYGNWSYKYGFVTELKPEAIALRKRNFEYYCKKNNRKITKRRSYEGSVNDKLDEMHNFAIACVDSLREDTFFDMLSIYFKKSKAFAISQGEALEFLSNYYAYSEEGGLTANSKKQKLYDKLLSYANFLVSEIYNYDSWRYGINTTKCLTEQQVKDRYNIAATYLLDDSDYISDLDLDVDDNIIVWGDTGLGKTTWICEKMKGFRLVLVPIIPLLTGISQKHNASVFYKDKKDVKEGDELIVCTYSSFPNLMKIMERWNNVKISDYELHFDEFHNNAVASNPDFRGYELNYIADNMNLFKKRVWYTGTMFPILHPSFKDVKILRIKAKNTAPKNFMRTKYDNLLYAIEHNLDKDNKNLIYLQNKREEGKLGELLDYLTLKGWNRDDIWCVNADNKNSIEFQNLIANERVDDNVKILICTSVVVEGVNINNPDFTTIHFMSHEGIVNTEQMVNRLRKVFSKNLNPNCMIHLYKKHNGQQRDEADQVDVVEIQKDLIELAKKGLDFFSTAYVSGDSVSKKIAIKLFTQSIFSKSAIYRNKEGDWDVDYLSIANMSYREEKNYCYHDVGFIQMMLSEYNWKFKGEQLILTDLSDREKGILRENKRFRKDELVEDVLEILDTIREDGEKITIELIDDANISELEIRERPEYEIGLRSKVKYLCNNMDFADACNLLDQWINADNMSDRIWKKMVRQINVQIAKKNDIFNRRYNVTTEFAQSLLKYYKQKLKKFKNSGEKQLLSISTIKGIITNRATKFNELIDVEITNDVALKIMRQYFDIKEFLVKKQVKYLLNGIVIANDVATFSNELDVWAKKQFEEETVLTTQELADQLNDIRSMLPILSMYKLSSNQAMRLIHDYYDFTRFSHKMVNGKRINTYKIVSMNPPELSNIIIRPLRKIDIKDKHFEDMTYNEKQIFNHQTQMDSITYYLNMSSNLDPVLA